jgi:hypothetical protein
MEAKEAVSCGFANGIVDDLGDSDWFDLSKIPTIAKLCNTDARTLTNAKKQFIMARDLEEIEKVIDGEAVALVDSWMDKDFATKVATFM